MYGVQRHVDRCLIIYSFIVGIGGSMAEVVLGRVVSGSGGSAMGVISVLLITGTFRDICVP